MYVTHLYNLKVESAISLYSKWFCLTSCKGGGGGGGGLKLERGCFLGYALFLKIKMDGAWRVIIFLLNALSSHDYFM